MAVVSGDRFHCINSPDTELEQVTISHGLRLLLLLNIVTDFYVYVDKFRTFEHKKIMN